MGSKYKRNKKGKRKLRRVWSQNKPEDKRHAIGSIASHIIDEFNERENAFARSLQALSGEELRPAPGKAMVQDWQRRTGSLDKWFPHRVNHNTIKFFCGLKYYFIKTDPMGKQLRSQTFAGNAAAADTRLSRYSYTIRWSEDPGD